MPFGWYATWHIWKQQDLLQLFWQLTSTFRGTQHWTNQVALCFFCLNREFDLLVFFTKIGACALLPMSKFTFLCSLTLYSWRHSTFLKRVIILLIVDGVLYARDTVSEEEPIHQSSLNISGSHYLYFTAVISGNEESRDSCSNYITTPTEAGFLTLFLFCYHFSPLLVFVVVLETRRRHLFFYDIS